MHAFVRLLLAAFCADLALYLVMLSLPFRALDLGASSAVLGLVPVLYALPYSLVALNAGRVSDRRARRTPIRLGLGLAVLGTLALSRAGSLWTMLACVPALGVGLGFFWPSLQAGFSELRAGRGLDRTVGWFNVAWSLGKGLGMLLGGTLLVRLGGMHLSEIAAAAFATAALVLPWMAPGGDHSEALREDPRRPDDATSLGFLRAAWIINGVNFGVVATLNHHLPRSLVERGFDSEQLGVFLGGMFFVQTLTFATIGRRDFWHYRRSALLAVPALIAVGVWAAPTLTPGPALLVLAAVLGVAAGFGYQSSIYYSLHAPHARGKQAGFHEASLGLASASIPLLGGWAVQGTHTRAPFLVAALAALVCLVASAWMLRRR